MNIKKTIYLFTLFLLLLVSACKDKMMGPDRPDIKYDPTPYTLELPKSFPILEIPEDNPLTKEGIKLGRMLFYDPILSGDSTLSCAGCHKQQYAFTDENRFSTGIDGLEGTRNAMHVMNITWVNKLFWDGRAIGLEAQALAPVEDPIEMHELWPNAMEKLKRHQEYPTLFFKAFGTWDITKQHAAKAIAQFERTLVSYNSKYDKATTNGSGVFFSDEELNGFEIYNTEKGDCFHCHGGILFTDNLFHNNGLDASFADNGLSKVTGKDGDIGRFKTPSLRNVALTAPYMHDGRFNTLEEVIDQYSEGVKFSPSVDALMKNVHQGGVQLTAQEKSDLLAFLHTLTDHSFIQNEEFSNPFE